MSGVFRPGEVMRFGVVGLIATGVHVGLFTLLVDPLRVRAVFASLVAFLGALLVSYAGHRHWTFSIADNRRSGSFPRFVVTACIGLAVSAGSTFFVVDILGASYLYAIGFVVFAVPACTFVLSKLWVFEGRREPT